MRWFLGALALTIAVPAQAQYTINFSGTGTYNAGASYGDVSDVLTNYGASITYSASIVLESGIYYPGTTDYAYTYLGKTLDVSVNGSTVPFISADPPATFNLEWHSGSARASMFILNGILGSNYERAVGGVFYWLLPDLDDNGEIPSDLLSNPSWPDHFLVTLGGLNGFAQYDFTATSYSLTGTQPTVTTWVDPVDPGAVPEPAAWAMMLGGFGLAGAAMRRRASRVSFAA